MTNEAIAAHLQKILQSEEFSGSAQQRLLEMLRAWFHRFELWAQDLSFWPRMALLVVCLGFLAVIAAQVVAAVREANLPSVSSAFVAASALDAQVTAALLFERSGVLADQGQVRDAARVLQQAIWVHMCRERGVAWRASRADWEWVDILRPTGRIVDLTRLVQGLAFGPQPSRASYDTCAREAASLLRTDTRAQAGRPT